MDIPLLPTFRLFVMHTKPLASEMEQDDLRDLFEALAPVTWFMTKRGSWKNSLITFASTADASRARNALQNVQFRGIPLRIEFARPTTRVLVRGLPRGTPVSVLRSAFPSALNVEHDNTWRGGDDFALVFERVRDAEAVVARGTASSTSSATAVPMKVDGHEVSFDFGNDGVSRRQTERRPEKRAPREKQWEQPSEYQPDQHDCGQQDRGMQSRRNEQSHPSPPPSRWKRSRSRSRSFAMSRSRSRSRSRSTSPSRSQPVVSRVRSRSPSVSIPPTPPQPTSASVRPFSLIDVLPTRNLQVRSGGDWKPAETVLQQKRHRVDSLLASVKHDANDDANDDGANQPQMHFHVDPILKAMSSQFLALWQDISAMENSHELKLVFQSGLQELDTRVRLRLQELRAAGAEP
jgi:hypothetical protein